MKKNRKSKRRRQFSGEIFKERAKNMNAEEKEYQDTPEQEENTAPETDETQPQEKLQEEQEPQQQEEFQQPDTEKLAKELEEAVRLRDEYLDLAQRQKAEFANYRRRTEGTYKEAYDQGRRDAVSALLPVVDNLERALAVEKDSGEALREGVEMVLRQTLDALTKLGVSEINPLGTPFDAMEMNAVMQGTEEEGEPGTVCQVFQKGYKMGDHVIRHAMVKVVAG